jgi:preprotein translocase subunit SecD
MFSDVVFDVSKSKFFFKDKITLGLDLQGGLYLVMGVDFNKVFKEVIDRQSINLKKQIEENTKAQFISEFNQLDAFKTDLESDLVLLSDAALSLMMKGEQIEVQDEYHNTYDPIFSVKFKKAN